jgi:hypothetical protein
MKEEAANGTTIISLANFKARLIAATKISERKILLQSYDILVRAKRIQYLKQLQRYVHEERPIVYTDESYIHSFHSQSKSWTDDSVLGLKKPISKGKRLIMVHASSKAGVVPNALLLFPSGTTY